MDVQREVDPDDVLDSRQYEQWTRAEVMESVADALNKIAELCGGNPYRSGEAVSLIEDSASFLGGAHGAALTLRWTPSGALSFVFSHTDPKNTNAPCFHSCDARGPFPLTSGLVALAYDVLSRDWHTKQ